jgi:hypothetical protein
MATAGLHEKWASMLKTLQAAGFTAKISEWEYKFSKALACPAGEVGLLRNSFEPRTNTAGKMGGGLEGRS